MVPHEGPRQTHHALSDTPQVHLRGRTGGGGGGAVNIVNKVGGGGGVRVKDRKAAPSAMVDSSEFVPADQGVSGITTGMQLHGCEGCMVVRYAAYVPSLGRCLVR
jgi:hypothetical protein